MNRRCAISHITATAFQPRSSKSDTQAENYHDECNACVT